MHALYELVSRLLRLQRRLVSLELRLDQRAGNLEAILLGRDERLLELLLLREVRLVHAVEPLEALDQRLLLREELRLVAALVEQLTFELVQLGHLKPDVVRVDPVRSRALNLVPVRLPRVVDLQQTRTEPLLEPASRVVLNHGKTRRSPGVAHQIHHRAAPLPLPELQRAEYRRRAVAAEGFGEDLREHRVPVAGEFPSLRRERSDDTRERGDGLVQTRTLA